MNQVEVEEEFEEDEDYFDAEEESLYPTGMFSEVNEIRVSEIPDLKQFQYRLVTGHSAHKGTRGERHWRLKAKARHRQSRGPRNSRYNSGSFEILKNCLCHIWLVLSGLFSLSHELNRKVPGVRKDSHVTFAG